MIVFDYNLLHHNLGALESCGAADQIFRQDFWVVGFV